MLTTTNNFKIRLKKKTLLIVSAIVLFLLLIIVTLQHVQNRKVLAPRQTTVVKPTAQTIISFSPTTTYITSSSPDNQNINIAIDTKANSIYGADVELLYDPSIIKNIKIQNGTFLPDAQVFNSTSRPSGKLSFIFALPPKHNPIKGTGVLANVSFTIDRQALKQHKQTSLSFLGGTQVSGSGNRFSVLQIAISGKLIYSPN